MPLVIDRHLNTSRPKRTSRRLPPPPGLTTDVCQGGHVLLGVDSPLALGQSFTNFRWGHGTRYDPRANKHHGSCYQTAIGTIRARSIGEPGLTGRLGPMDRHRVLDPEVVEQLVLLEVDAAPV